VIACVAQELWRGTAARRAMTRDPIPLAVVALVRRNRRRYGGYIVHAGLAVLLIGVAASSSFQHSTNATLMPGQSATVGGYTIRYVRPTYQVSAAKVSFGAVLDVSKGGKHVSTLTTTHGLYPAPDDPTVGPISEAFNGEGDSQVGLQSGFTRDIWTVINPDLTPIQPLINRGDTLFTKLMTSLTATQASNPATVRGIEVYRAEAIEGLASRFVSHPWPVNFLFIVSPLVMWIWLGAIIIAAGALIALWPIPAAVVRRRTAVVGAAPRRSAASAVAARETV
jgi:cytochrome c-type biogenesis protein CcmF